MDEKPPIMSVTLDELNILEAVQSGFLNSTDFQIIGIAEPCVIRMHGITPSSKEFHVDFVIEAMQLLSISDKFITLVSSIRSAKN